MAVLIKKGKLRAFFRDGEWVAACPRFEASIRAAMALWINGTGGPKLNDPAPERTTALAVCSAVGARVDVVLAPRCPGEVHARFAQMRQMTLF